MHYIYVLCVLSCRPPIVYRIKNVSIISLTFGIELDNATVNPHVILDP